MSDKTTTNLTAATTFASTDLLYGVVGGNSRKIAGSAAWTFGSVAIGAGSAITSSGAGGAMMALAFTTPGTGIATALGINVGSAGAPILFNGAGGTPSSMVGTNITGTAAGLTAGAVTTNANLTGPITSVGNATSIASQTGTGTKFVMDTSPTLVTPAIGVATGTSLSLSGSGNFQLTAASSGNGGIVVSKTSNKSAYLGAGTNGAGFEFDSAGFFVISPNPSASVLSGAFSGTPAVYVGGNGNDIRFRSGAAVGFTSTADASGTVDTASSRVIAGFVGFGTGAAGNGAGGIFLSERTAPAAPASDGVYIYAQDNGGGKTQLMALFSSGAAQQVAIQP